MSAICLVKIALFYQKKYESIVYLCAFIDGLFIGKIHDRDNIYITYKKPSAERTTPLSALDTKKK